jgi:hypothetical protein
MARSRCTAFFLGLPACRDGVETRLEIGQFLFQSLEPLFGSRVGLLAQRLPLDLQLHDAAPRFVHLRRHGIDFRPQPRQRNIGSCQFIVSNAYSKQISRLLSIVNSNQMALSTRSTQWLSGRYTRTRNE